MRLNTVGSFGRTVVEPRVAIGDLVGLARVGVRIELRRVAYRARPCGRRSVPLGHALRLEAARRAVRRSPSPAPARCRGSPAGCTASSSCCGGRRRRTRRRSRNCQTPASCFAVPAEQWRSRRPGARSAGRIFARVEAGGASVGVLRRRGPWPWRARFASEVDDQRTVGGDEERGHLRHRRVEQEVGRDDADAGVVLQPRGLSRRAAAPNAVRRDR